jgi:hypothetical protein
LIDLYKKILILLHNFKEVFIMKKHLKTFAGLTLSALMAVATVTSAFAEDAVTMTGSIAAADLAVNVTLPTSGALTIKPYAAEQISTATALAFKSGEKAGGTTYQIALSGYTATAASKSSDDPISVETSEITESDDNTAKQITLNIQVGTAVDTTTVTAAKTADAWAALFTTPEIDEGVSELSSADYKKAGDTKTAATDTDKVELAPVKSAPFRITGTMNSGANWVVGDKITVTPVFKVTAKKATAETTTA